MHISFLIHFELSLRNRHLLIDMTLPDIIRGLGRDCGTMLCTLSATAMDQASPTQDKLKKVGKFLHYAAIYVDAILPYPGSNMIRVCHSSASYLSASSSCQDTPIPPKNGAVLNIPQLTKTVMTSAANAEIGDLCINSREAIPA